MSKKGLWEIKVKDIPETTTIHQYLLANTDFSKKTTLFKNRPYSTYLELPFHFELEALKKTLHEARETFSFHRFLYQDIQGPSSYLSASLTYNPRSIDQISEDPHAGTLGSKVFQKGSSDAYETESVRNSYSDTYSFRIQTPLAQFKEMKTVTESFKRTLIRSRVSIILSGQEEAMRMKYGWHNDENIFLNLRVNVPVQTSSNYVIQIIENDSGDKLDITEFTMKEGFAYAYDTQKNHRPLCRKLDPVDRIHLILGVSPWFDYDANKEAWVSNEFYGEMHPFDMLAGGHVSSLIYR